MQRIKQSVGLKCCKDLSKETRSASFNHFKISKLSIISFTPSISKSPMIKKLEFYLIGIIQYFSSRLLLHWMITSFDEFCFLITENEILMRR
jgi:hypothetical protein